MIYLILRFDMVVNIQGRPIIPNNISPLGPDRKQMWKFWPFSPWNMILWCTKHISFHCEGAEKCIFHALFMITNWNYVLWRLLILLISTHPFILSIYHILDFWCKIRFRIHIIIIQGQMHPLKKNHKKLTVEGGEVNLYGQPDRKILVVFLRLPLAIYSFDSLGQFSW